jgi:hypothetical protein
VFLGKKGARCAYVCSGGGAAGRRGWLIGRLDHTRLECGAPASISEGAAIPGSADMDAIAAELSAIWWSGDV